LKNTQISNFMKISLVEAELCLEDRGPDERMDRQAGRHDKANAPESGSTVNPPTYDSAT
jgi:hypothetical protein